MKAVILNEYGSASVLQSAEIEKPACAAGQVLIRIIASAVNPLDTKIRAGYMAGELPKTFPMILGWEASGIVAAVGSSVQNLKVGDAVYTQCNMMQGGTYAEYASVNETETARKPKTLSFIQAASVPLAGSTAYTAIVKLARVQKGQKVLIHGAAGSVGSFAVQIAKALGAYVIGTASGEGVELVKSLGADQVIDHSTTDFQTVVKDADLVLDVVGGQTYLKSFSVLKKGGLLLTTLPAAPSEKAAAYGIDVRFFSTQPDAAILTQLAEWIDEGNLKIPALTILNLSQAAQAHEMIENRTAKGKLVFAL